MDVQPRGTPLELLSQCRRHVIISRLALETMIPEMRGQHIGINRAAFRDDLHDNSSDYVYGEV